jgi:uncharacterized membrane protein YgcG
VGQSYPKITSKDIRDAHTLTKYFVLCFTY